MKWLRILELLRQGQRVAAAGAWKNVQMLASVIVALGGVLVAFGVGVDLSEQDAAVLAGGFIAGYEAVQVLITVISSRKVGLPRKDSFDIYGYDDPEQDRAPVIDDDDKPIFIKTHD